MRTTCNTNPAGGHHQEFTALKFVRVFLKHPIEVINLGLQSRAGEAKENDAGMSTLLVKNNGLDHRVGHRAALEASKYGELYTERACNEVATSPSLSHPLLTWHELR